MSSLMSSPPTKKGIWIASEYEAAAKKRGCALIPVILTCEVAENERKLRSRERLGVVEGDNGMLVDTDCAETVPGAWGRSQVPMFRAAGLGGYGDYARAGG